uniref:Uncharacterized protein n=1 Tax=Anopheles farauti TaxID=69004 RepID=A0A182Q8C7_9DIPT
MWLRVCSQKLSFVTATNSHCLQRNFFTCPCEFTFGFRMPSSSSLPSYEPSSQSDPGSSSLVGVSSRSFGDFGGVTSIGEAALAAERVHAVDALGRRWVGVWITRQQGRVLLMVLLLLLLKMQVVEVMMVMMLLLLLLLLLLKRMLLPFPRWRSKNVSRECFNRTHRGRKPSSKGCFAVDILVDNGF